MNVWRIQLKSDSKNGGAEKYDKLLEFCRDNSIIGVGWCLIECHEDDYNALYEEVCEKYGTSDKEVQNRRYRTAAFKAVNAVRQMKEGDLVWTRCAGSALEYYLCRVGKTLWKDRVVTDTHRKYDIGNFVSAEWKKIGNVENVPGKIVNSFIPSASAQRVVGEGVNEISERIWNHRTLNSIQIEDLKKGGFDYFWNATIGYEELECLVLLYLQSKGYYVYSTTIKRSTGTIEAALIEKDGSHRAYPQVKCKYEPLYVADYLKYVASGTNKVFLFTKSEEYGNESHPQIVCITKKELEEFIISKIEKNPEFFPKSIMAHLVLSQ